MPTVPSWSEAVVVGNITEPRTVSLALQATTRGAIDLRSKHGAYFFPRIGRTGTSALTNPISVLIRRLMNATSISDLGLSQPGPQIPLVSGLAASTNTTVNADSAAGQNQLNVASSSSYANGQYILINGGGAREEFGRVSKVGTGTITLDDALRFTHTAAQSDIVTTQGDVFQPVWMMGGAIVEVVFDYGYDTTGNTVRVECRAQVYDSDLTT